MGITQPEEISIKVKWDLALMRSDWRVQGINLAENTSEKSAAHPDPVSNFSSPGWIRALGN